MENIMERTAKRTKHWSIKMFAICAAFLMLLVGLSLLHVGADATAAELAEQTITLSDVEVNRGQEFDVDISIGNNSSGIQAIRLFVTYNPDVMTLLSVTPKDPVPTENWTSEFEAAGKDSDGTYGSYGYKRFPLVWVNSSKWYGEGTIATLRFLSKSSAAAGDYKITVTVDPKNTLLALRQECDLAVSGGTVTMLPGAYSIFLYDAYGSEYAYLESNTESSDVTIEKALESRLGLTPTKESTQRYTYTFRGWEEVQSGDHAKYKPTYTATPVPYNITFKKGVKDDGSDEVRYTGDNVSEHVVTIPYAKIINYDAEIPAAFSQYYSFHGWYKDEACTEPVDFVVMQDSDTTVYGYFGVNVDEPSVTTTALSIEKEYVKEGGDDYLIATVRVTENYGINSLLFTPTFDAEKLEFVGFLYESDSPFALVFDPEFPKINAATTAGEDVIDAWQIIDEQESIEDKAFLFLNTYANVMETGKLLKLKFKVIAAGESTIGLAISGRSVTRYDAADAIYYANALVNEAAVNVIRVTKPTAYTTAEKTYTYVPNGSVTYTFKENGDDSYYTLSGATNSNVGGYTATATLKAVSGALVTWDDGSDAALDFDYEILPFVVTKPVPTDDEYVYSNGDTLYFAFTQESKVDSAYYTISGGEESAAGAYVVTASLSNTDNFVWEGNTTDDQTYDFVIKRIRVVKPTAYTAQEKTYSFNPGTKVPYEYNNDGENVTYTFKAEDSATKGYYTSSGGVKSDVGNYTVTVTLNDVLNTEWADDNETVDVDPLEYPFTIGKYAIATPTVQPKQYTGEPLTAEISLPQNSPFKVEPQTPQTEIGEYDVVFTIYDEFADRYEWKEPVTPGSLSAKGIFEITGGLVNEWTIAPYVNSKTYDGTPVVTGAMAKYGTTINVLYRLQSATDDDYTAEAPVDAGAYYAKFSVPAEAGGAYDELTCDPIPFEIYKVRLNKPLAYTSEERSYTFTGSPVIYVFKQAGNAEIYEVTGNEHTDAGTYTVTASIKEEYRTNYIWKGATEAEDTLADQTYPFVIAKAQIAIPVSAEKTYVYTGEEQTFDFSVVEYSGRYTILNNKQTAVGKYTVIARIENENKKNYEWVDHTTDDKTFPFEIRFASIEDSTEDEAITLRISSQSGFDADSTFTVTKAAVDRETVLAAIAAAEKSGALGQMTDEAAANAVVGKCLVASIHPDLLPVAGAGTYIYSFELSDERDNITVIRFVGEDVEVFAVTKVGDTVSFESDGIGDFLILADHAYVNEVAEPAYLVSKADCDNAAVYYKSCDCGATNGQDTFVYGEALGHDYDMESIEWRWVDHTSVTAKVVCRRDSDHVRIFSGEEIEIEVIERVPAGPETTGKVVRQASFTYKGVTYSDTDEERLPAGHIFTNPTPRWKKTETETGFAYKAIFICDCGETSAERDATVTVDTESDSTKIIYNAEVEFQGVIYRMSEEIDRPYVIFDFVDGTPESSFFMLPGESVTFLDVTGHERDGYLFVGWRDETGTLIVKDADGKYFDYKIGVSSLRFSAEWKMLIPVNVSVVDTDGEPIGGATVALYEDDILVFSAVSSAAGEATFPTVPNGNYKLVVTYPYTDETDIVRSSYLDVIDPSDEGGIRVSVVLPRTKFNTIVEGVGSAEGLEGAISEEEKSGITDGTEAGSVNEIVITQKRTTNVSAWIKEQIGAEVRLSSEYRFGQLVDYYDVTMIETKTVRKANGDKYVTERKIDVAENYQTNIFPITTQLREQIAAVNGTVDNIFVYKRHDYGFDVVAIYNLPKYSQAEGENAQTECFFIKRVGGEEYIAVRQKEYSVLAFGVSPDPILLTNAIEVLTIEDWTYGESANSPVIRARYGETTAQFFYATEKGGEYTSVVPTEAGTYYLKAVIPATGEYAGAMKADVAFRINKKTLADVGNITFEDKRFWFDGKKHSIEINGELPEGVTVEYIGNEEWDLGKFTVTAVFVSSNPNIDVSEPMTAVMHIRLNWIPILILIIVALLLIIAVIIIVEKMLKRRKEEENPPDENPDGDDSNAANAEENANEEGSNND